MKTLTSVLAALSLAGNLPAGEQVSVPWAEFKQLYEERIAREVMQTQAGGPTRGRKPPVYTIEEAVYDLAVGKDHAAGEVLVSGRVIAGDAAPIPLFGPGLTVARIGRIRGGALLSGQDGAGRIAFLPDGGKSGFQVTLSFMVRPQEDDRSRFIRLDVPPALRSSLRLRLSPETDLLEEPGIPDADGVYHFSAPAPLVVRYLDRQGVAAGRVNIDSFSRIRLEGRRATVTTAFVPVQPPPPCFILQVQDNAQYASSSLPSSCIVKRPDGSYAISLPADAKGPFTMQFAVDGSPDGAVFAFRLPRVRDNGGREGDFVPEEPDDGQISLAGNGLAADIPVAKLGPALMPLAGEDRFYAHIAPHEEVALTVRRFAAVSTPPIVLDAQRFYVSFEENGGVLSVLALDIPPEMGPRLRLKPVPDTEIWSLTVNGRKRQVYADGGDAWIIPLQDGQVSRIELALLRKGAKLGLRGRLEAVLPGTGLPSRTLRVGIALPARVELLSLEGPLSPAPGDARDTPAEFVGKPHFFSRSFYEGQGLQLAVSYREPADGDGTPSAAE